MSNEEKFKKTLQDLVNSKEFPMAGADWEQASAYFDSQRRKKRRVIFLWLLLGGLLVGTGVWFTAFEPAENNMAHQVSISSDAKINPETGKTSVPAGKNVQPHTGEGPAPAHKDRIISSDPDNTRIKENPPANPIKQNSEDTFPDQKKSSVASTSSSLEKQKIKKTGIPLPTASPLESHPKKTHDVDLPKKANSDKKHDDDEALTRLDADEKEGEKEKPSEKKAVAVQPSLAGDPPVEEQADQTTEETKIARLHGENETESDESAEEEPVVSMRSAVPDTALKNENGENAVDINPTESPVSVAVGEQTDQDRVAEKQAVPAVAASDSVPKRDSVNQYPRVPRLIFSVEAGAMYVLGWSRPLSKEAAGLNPFVGLQLHTSFSEQLTFSYGLQYYQVGRMKTHNYTARVSRFNLGEESEVTVFTPSKIHYLAAPLRLNYKYGNNTFGIACNIAYLLTVDVQVVNYVEKFNGVSNMSTYTDRGYTKGFKTFDTQVALYYRRMFTKNWGIMAETFYGFSDVKDDQFFSENFHERNRGIKLGLVYDIYK